MATSLKTFLSVDPGQKIGKGTVFEKIFGEVGLDEWDFWRREFGEIFLEKWDWRSFSRTVEQ